MERFQVPLQTAEVMPVDQEGALPRDADLAVLNPSFLDDNFSVKGKGCDHAIWSSGFNSHVVMESGSGSHYKRRVCLAETKLNQRKGDIN
ncbi:hypothetical protein MLD38_000461 [Melastoma candidum]|uniref:Uncharacterized protein n=1 Tax=Melastoma candidum TaxID=119954 RepID=A0ACB9SE34_9MYRT|nr:hypothetical protein MLD38_000461 [Melastoma candidum]